jgi:hypothetical protein
MITSTAPRRSARLAVACLLLSLLVVPAAPAVADTPPGGGGECSNVMNESVPAPGKLKFTWTMRCNRNLSKIEHGITIQRPGFTTHAYRHCTSTSGTLRVCSRSVTVNDPSGVQHWKTYDETARYAMAGGGAVRATYSAGAYH